MIVKDLNSPGAPRRYLPLLLVLFACSGCSALIYEIVWYQLLQLVIGSSAVSLGVLLATFMGRSEEHTSELQSLRHLVCRLLLEKKKEQESLRRASQRPVQLSNMLRFAEPWRRRESRRPQLLWAPTCSPLCVFVLFFFFIDRATPEISPLPPRDALPI